MIPNIRSLARHSLPSGLLWRLSHVRLAYADIDNFGDQLGPLLVKRLFGLSVKHSGPGAADLITAGSLMEHFESTSSKLRPVVWGTGFIQAGGTWSGPDFRPAAVRGKLSLGRIKEVTGSREVALGDPGLLTPWAFPHLANNNGQGPIAVIPHFIDATHPEITALDGGTEDLRIIDVCQPPEKVIPAIASSRLVLSSSLHGLIVADSFNIPNAWTPLSNNVIGGSYKFRDYYSAFDLTPTPAPFREALASADEIVRSWKPRPRLAHLQSELYQAFPGPKIARGNHSRILRRTDSDPANDGRLRA